ncbi:flagellar basal-body rod protein FlgG [Treponema succinifaciens]|uniref:Flagellar basal-body rod protein FlgG n=1 Tax=Treponema succinifaciens (strain ATCC 33096 / DSM 2489 / 6091) TaxID=869209 RepID=F2NSR9_TRES6|nr:flagellar basal-body rod protein FlgG [Treponema succinifaciens]AEB14307.1 flagellar basal-body rod protein FlgG [Treponema succinifaciens DSM 2489]
MVRSLWNAATGMNGQQMNIDTISNNLSNVNTTGFKQHRAEFEDLLYQNVKLAGTPATEDTVTPVGHQMGSGVKVGATQRIMTQGSLQATGVDTDVAVVGDGFFRVQQYDGSWAYTRDGSFKVDSTGQLVTANGLRVMPEIIMPEGFQLETLSISDGGRVNIKVNGELEPVEVGQLELYRFPNAVGLENTGDNLYKVTNASGEPIAGRPGIDGMGITKHKFLEMSNVSVVNEMVQMIVAQRAYEFNSKAIQTSDNMLQTAAGLKR